MTTSTAQSRAQIAYTAYGHAVGFANTYNEVMPMWGNLPETRRAGWILGADRVWTIAKAGGDRPADDAELAELFYTTYGDAVGFVGHRGEVMPAYAEQDDERRKAWTVAATTVWDLATTGQATIGDDNAETDPV